MSKGKRYDEEKKLNIKKVIACISVVLIIALFIFAINKILKMDKQTTTTKNIELNYFTLFSNGNWGVINSSGDTVIEPAYGEMIVIPNKAKPVFILTYEVNYVDGSYKTKAINDKNQELFIGYDNIAAIQNYDENNNLWFEENVLKVQKEGKYGLINLDGKEILACEYDDISSLKGIKGSLLIKKDGKLGLANTTGTVVIPTEYSEITSVTKDFKDGYIVKNIDGKFGVINYSGNKVLDCKYEEIKHIANENMYVTKLDGAWSITKNDGNMYLTGKVDNIISINNGRAIVNNNDKYSALNITETQNNGENEENNANNVVSDYQYLYYIYEDKYIAKKDEKYGIINTNNETVVEFKYIGMEFNNTSKCIKAKNEDGTFDLINNNLEVKLTTDAQVSIINNYLALEKDNNVTYYNYNLDEKNNKEVYSSNTLFVIKENEKFGFVNKDGKKIVEPIYDDVTEQNDYGFVSVKKDGKWGCLDQFGNVVIEPTYILDNNKVIDFIGKWHICADINANYYTNAQ